MGCELIINHCRPNTSPRSWYPFLVHCPIGGYQSPQSTCRNCGGGDRGRVAIYRPFGEFRRAKIVLSPVWCSRPTTGVPLAHATMNFVGLDLTTSDRPTSLVKGTSRHNQRETQLLGVTTLRLPCSGGHRIEPTQSLLPNPLLPLVIPPITIHYHLPGIKKTKTIRF
ncbi:hypothetical protein TNCV_3578821 [Trichonephila clavipes]|nr:hypothetical protein TNCV_3578821 [Trichonephila clavipes]